MGFFLPLLTWIPVAIKGLDILIKGHSLTKSIKFSKSEHSFWIVLNVGGKEVKKIEYHSIIYKSSF